MSGDVLRIGLAVASLVLLVLCILAAARAGRPGLWSLFMSLGGFTVTVAWVQLQLIGRPPTAATILFGAITVGALLGVAHHLKDGGDAGPASDQLRVPGPRAAPGRRRHAGSGPGTPGAGEPA